MGWKHSDAKTLSWAPCPLHSSLGLPVRDSLLPHPHPTEHSQPSPRNKSLPPKITPAPTPSQHHEGMWTQALGIYSEVQDNPPFRIWTSLSPRVLDKSAECGMFVLKPMPFDCLSLDLDWGSHSAVSLTLGA